MPAAKRELLISRIADLYVRLVDNFEEERCDPEKGTIRRLEAVGVNPKTFFPQDFLIQEGGSFRLVCALVRVGVSFREEEAICRCGFACGV